MPTERELRELRDIHGLEQPVPTFAVASLVAAPSMLKSAVS